MSKVEQLNRTIEEVWRERYVVPLYQRNFAWTEDQIGQLLQDLYDHSPNGYLGKASAITTILEALCCCNVGMAYGKL